MAPSRRALLILAAATTFLAPSASMADMNYTFITMTCNSDSKAVEIKAFYDWNESGRARVKRHEKGTYYLDEVAGKGAIKCDLGNGQTISFRASQGDLPKHSALAISIDDRLFPQYSLGYGAWNLNVQFNENNDYQLKYCSAEPMKFPQFQPEWMPYFKGDRQVCEVTQIVNGQALSSHIEDENSHIIYK